MNAVSKELMLDCDGNADLLSMSLVRHCYHSCLPLLRSCDRVGCAGSKQTHVLTPASSGGVCFYPPVGRGARHRESRPTYGTVLHGYLSGSQKRYKPGTRGTSLPSPIKLDLHPKPFVIWCEFSVVLV